MSSETTLKLGPYQPDHPEILSAIEDYGSDREAWEHDNLIECHSCGNRFYVGNAYTGDIFDADIRDYDGLFVCHECVPEYLEAASYDPAREHDCRSWR